jgi:anti-sigma regulatory factor (Ser/Thr protein kinase)
VRVGPERLGHNEATPASTQTETFTPDVASAGAARRFVARVAGLTDDDAAERLAFLVSEVATNAILHARTLFSVRVIVDATVCVEVSDGSPAMPVQKDYGPTATTGRGLLIVDKLADRWGVRATDTGKVVWFEIAEPQRGRVA